MPAAPSPARALAFLALAVGLTLTGCASSTSSSPTSSASPAANGTPSSLASAASSTCMPGESLTELTEGPYYSEGAPERATISDDATAGIPLTVTGTVFDAACAPAPGVLLDFWQADGNGDYDNSGYSLRGKQTTDAQGRYTLTTVIPGLYPGRTEHIHVKLTPPGGTTVTTQLFFPGAEQNVEDGIFVPSMLVTVLEESPSAMSAAFNFVLP